MRKYSFTPCTVVCRGFFAGRQREGKIPYIMESRIY